MHNEKLKKAREKTGLTQSEVAKKINVKLTSYQRFEYGSRRPSLDTALEIAKILGTTVEELFS